MSLLLCCAEPFSAWCNYTAARPQCANIYNVKLVRNEVHPLQPPPDCRSPDAAQQDRPACHRAEMRKESGADQAKAEGAQG